VRLVVVAALAAPVGAFVGNLPAYALSCASGDIVVGHLKAVQASVAVGQSESFVAKAINCTGQTLNLTEVDKIVEPPPCGTTSGSNGDTYTPHQVIKNSFAFPMRCSGANVYSIRLYQGSVLVLKVSASWTVSP
jgi:hypothetical protein